MRSQRLLLLLVCLVGLLRAPAYGAVTFANVGSNQINSLSSTLGIPITVTAGTDRVMIIGFCTTNSSGSPVNEVVSVTFDEQPATLLAWVASTVSDQIHAHLYRLTAPNVVASSVAITLSNTRRIAGGAIVLHGVHQGTPTDTTQTAANADNSTSISVDAVTEVGDMLVDLGCKRVSTDALVMQAQTNRTQRYNIASDHTTPSNNIIAAGSTRTGSGSLTMNWSDVAQVGYIVHAVNINASVAAPPAGRLSVGFKLLR